MRTSKLVLLAFSVAPLLLALWLGVGPAGSFAGGFAPGYGQASVFLPAVFRPAIWPEVGTGSATGGGISNNSTASYQCSLAVAPDGTVYVAWGDEGGGDSEIYVRRWNGSSWQEVGGGSATGGGISDNSGGSYIPAVAVAPDGTPYVTWRDDSSGDYEIYVRRWNGSSWQEVGSGSATGGGISNNGGNSLSSSVAIAPNGTPYIAWADLSGGDAEIYVRRWNGSSWQEVGSGSAGGGGISNNNGDSQVTSLAIAPNGTPYVAWQDDSGGDVEIYVRHWNGSSWLEVGTGSAGGGGISANSGASTQAALAVGPDNMPVVAWEDVSSGMAQIYVRRWNGANWVEVGAGSAGGGGISNTNGGAHVPAVAADPADPAGRFVVTWSDDSPGESEIYVRWWNGSSWIEAGAGSASGGGISDNAGGS
ncbi:MAG: hypothetical protein L0322_00915, partial [Chloroflexi bacterium]|nr:hypothetical protein [Chloroflexota bacterium]